LLAGVTSLQAARFTHEFHNDQVQDGLRHLLRQQLGQLSGGSDLVVESLPFSFHLVAARSPTTTYVWEVAMPQKGIACKPDAEYLSDFAYHGYRATTFSWQLSPDTGRILSSTSEVDSGIIWDARSGEEFRRIPNARIHAVSPNGHKAVGLDLNKSGLAYWNIQTGFRITWPQYVEKVEYAAFSPKGDRFAAVVRHHAAFNHPASVSIGAWDTESGLPLAVMEHQSDFLHYQYPARLSGSYDGVYLVLCQGPDLKAECFNLAGGSGGCDTYSERFPRRLACSDAAAIGEDFLYAGLFIYFHETHVKIKPFPKDSSEAHEVDMQDITGQPQGAFSPDGRKALVWWVTWSTYPHIYNAYIWCFADGLAPVRIPERMAEAPTFSATSDAIASVVDRRQTIAIWDLKGKLRLRLAAPGMDNARGVTLGDCCPW